MLVSRNFFHVVSALQFIANFCARRQNFIQLVRFLFNNFRCSIGQRINTVKNMAAIVEVTWEGVLSSIDNLSMEAEIQDNNSDLGFHEAAVVLNRLYSMISMLVVP